jgi:cyclic dehypoxanthinyl futalosine synthase
MIEENVVSAAGSSNRFNAEQMQSIIKEAGFIPGRRNQKYELLNPPPNPPNGGLV